jgi:hypothetical protein
MPDDDPAPMPSREAERRDREAQARRRAENALRREDAVRRRGCTCDRVDDNGLPIPDAPDCPVHADELNHDEITGLMEAP